jgi:Transglutaminase-like superfamily
MRWCSVAHPPLDRLLLSLASQFHSVDATEALELLDDLARPAFGAAGFPAAEAAGSLVSAIGGEAGFGEPSELDREHLMFDRVLESRRGHPALLAAVYFEVARRAGLSPSLLSWESVWFVGLGDTDELVLVSPTGFDPPGRAMDLSGRCAHAVADAVLARLEALLRERDASGDAGLTPCLREVLRAGGSRGGRGSE